MSVEIIAEHVNPLLGRKDAKLIVHHEGTGTPDRLAIRKIASDHFKTQQDKVYVRSVRTRTGGSSAVCQVEVYGDSKLADKIVPAYIKNRNLPKDQRVSKKKGAEEEKPALQPQSQRLRKRKLSQLNQPRLRQRSLNRRLPRNQSRPQPRPRLPRNPKGSLLPSRNQNRPLSLLRSPTPNRKPRTVSSQKAISGNPPLSALISNQSPPFLEHDLPR